MEKEHVIDPVVTDEVRRIVEVCDNRDILDTLPPRVPVRQHQADQVEADEVITSHALQYLMAIGAVCDDEDRALRFFGFARASAQFILPYRTRCVGDGEIQHTGPDLHDSRIFNIRVSDGDSKESEGKQQQAVAHRAVNLGHMSSDHHLLKRVEDDDDHKIDHQKHHDKAGPFGVKERSSDRLRYPEGKLQRDEKRENIQYDKI